MLTCSRFKDVLSRSVAYRDQVRAELAGEQVKSFSNAATQWGTDSESLGVAAYELHAMKTVRKVGFVVHPKKSHVGGSPDGMVDPDGMIEVKCPFNGKIHEATRVLGVPDNHLPQIHGLMWVTGRQWCDFVSFDPRRDPPHDLFVERIARDQSWIARLERACDVFWGMVQGEVENIGVPSIF